MIIVVFLLALLKSIFFSYFGLNLFDYGESLHNAIRLLEGNVLYRDIWATFPPADNYFPALIIGLLGERLLVLRFAQSLLFSMFIVVLALIARQFLSRKFVVLLIIAIIFSNTGVHLLFFNLFFYTALLFALHFLKQHSYHWIFFSGLALGMGTLFRHDVGLAISLTILAVLLLAKVMVRNKLNAQELLFSIALFVVGAVLVIAPIGLWLFHLGTLDNFLFLAFIKAPNISRILSQGFGEILSNSFSWPITHAKRLQTFTLFFYLSFMSVYPSVGIMLYRSFLKTRLFRWKDLVVISLLMLGIFQIPYVFSVIDMGHLIKGGLPALVLGVYFIQQGLRIKNLSRAKKAVLILPLSIFILGNLIISFWWARYHDAKVNFKQGSVFINSRYLKGTTHPTASTLSRSVKFIQNNTKKGDYIFVVPYHAMLYFLSERKAPSRFNNFAAGVVSEEEQEEVMADIKKKDVNVVVYDLENAPHGKRFADYNPKIHAYLMNTFEIVETTEEGWLFMKRKQ